MKRNTGISIMNAFLCLSVCMIHITSAPLAEATPGSLFYGIVFFANKILCFCVPGFIFLSGYKLFGKYNGKKVDIKSFFSARVKKIIVPYVVSVLIYFAYFYFKSWVSFNELAEFLLLGTLAAHFYYVVIAVQLYLLFPVLKSLYEGHRCLTVVAALICTVIFAGLMSFKYCDRFFGTYIFYFVLGFLFSDKKKSQDTVGGGIALLIFCVPAAVHMYFAYVSSLGKMVYTFGNLVNIVYVTAGIFAIYILSSKYLSGKRWLCRWSDALGRISYNVYLYHILVIFVLQYDVYPKFSLYTAQKLVITFLVVYLSVFIYAFCKNKAVQK